MCKFESVCLRLRFLLLHRNVMTLASACCSAVGEGTSTAGTYSFFLSTKSNLSLITSRFGGLRAKWA